MNEEIKIEKLKFSMISVVVIEAMKNKTDKNKYMKPSQ